MNESEANRRPAPPFPVPHGPWTIQSRHEVYRDNYVDVWVDQGVRPDGDPGQHVVVAMKPGVCVLALDSSGNLVLTSEFHYAVGRWSLEGVSGGIEPGESPAVTARRELAEELGFTAETWEELGQVDPFTTIIVSPTRLYCASHLQPCPTGREGTETIVPVTLSLAEAVRRVEQGEITHAPTCVAILLLHRRRSSKPNPS